MANPNRDVSNTKADNVLSPKRQKEIADFLALLKKFRPTKIAVELPVEQEAINERYNQYLAKNYQLSSNEVDQIGFRLANELNQKKIYTIDWQGNFDFDKVMEAAKSNNQTRYVEPMTKFGEKAGRKFQELQETSTITQILHALNDDAFVNESHKPYLQIAGVGKEKNYEGADLTRDWYERNLKIFANILHITDSQKDRILVLIGAGHLKLLRQFAAESGEYKLEKTTNYF